MAGDVLDTRTLNRALLARQLLLERSRHPIPRVVERIGGLQTQYAPSAYIGLWSRLEGFTRPHLTRALERGSVIQATLMRVTIHIVSATDYPVLTEAVRASRQEWWRRVAQAGDLHPSEWARAAFIVTQTLTQRPRKAAELIDVLAASGYSKDVWNGVGLFVDLIRVPPSGTWEHRRADLYGLAADHLEMKEIGEMAALQHLARRYLGGFGPAQINDLSSWSGVSVTRLRPAVERMSLRTFHDVEGNELIDLPRRPIPDADTPAPVRFLPTWDATLLAHARSTQILPEEYRSVVFHVKNPQSVPTFLVDGAVAGIWRPDAGRVKLEPFTPLPRPIRREAEEEAARLASFLQ